MLILKSTACINADPDTTWRYLANLENISSWSEAVVSAYCPEQKQGQGTERICKLKNNVEITERWIDWQEGKSYTYEGFNLPMISTAINTWSIEAVNGKTLLTTNAKICLKAGFLGRLFEPLMAIAFKKMSADALAAFAYLVENGKPYAAKHASLPRVSASC